MHCWINPCLRWYCCWPSGLFKCFRRMCVYCFKLPFTIDPSYAFSLNTHYNKVFVILFSSRFEQMCAHFSGFNTRIVCVIFVIRADFSMESSFGRIKRFYWTMMSGALLRWQLIKSAKCAWGAPSYGVFCNFGRFFQFLSRPTLRGSSRTSFRQRWITTPRRYVKNDRIRNWIELNLRFSAGGPSQLGVQQSHTDPNWIFHRGLSSLHLHRRVPLPKEVHAEPERGEC